MFEEAELDSRMKSVSKPLRVLIVDDHPLVRMGIRHAMERCFARLEVDEAATAQEARERWARQRPDLVVLDVHLPGTSGLDLCREIVLSDKLARILMVSAEVDPWTVSAAMQAGASGFLAKTDCVESLPVAVEAILAGRTHLCAVSAEAWASSASSHEPEETAPGPSVLSEREREVLRYLAHGENTKTTAVLLRISPKTVETHRSHLMRKLRIDSVAGLTRYAIRHGLTRP